MLNWILATQLDYDKAEAAVSPYDRRIELDTPNGKMEFVLQHVNLLSDVFENLVHKMSSDCFLSDTSLQRLLPVDGGL